MFVFLDLDDTLFQTAGKCPSGVDLRRATDSPLDRSSFMTPKQERLLAWLVASATVVPVTARNLGAFRRVKLQFKHAVVLNFGGTVLLPNGELDKTWDSQVRPLLTDLTDDLQEICSAWQDWCEINQLDIRVRLVSDFEISHYVVAKHQHGNLQELNRLWSTGSQWIDTDKFAIFLNGNNLAVVPRCLGKDRAVEYLKECYVNSTECLTLGIGDSLSDLGFLTVCDYAIIPRGSQIQQQRLGIDR